MEVKFKNGDSIAIPEGCKAVVKDNVVIFEPIEQKFKRGDFLSSKHNEFSVIFKKYKRISFDSFFNNGLLDNEGWDPAAFRLATPEEKAELIQYMRENGKDWDAEKCEVVDYRWRAEKGGAYYVVSASMGAVSMFESFSETDTYRFDFGNYFKTEELAMQATKMINELLLTLKHS